MSSENLQCANTLAHCKVVSSILAEVRCDLANGSGHLACVFFRHRFVQGYLNTRIQNLFRHRTIDFGVIHIRQSQIAHRPSAVEKAMFGKHGEFVNRNLNISRAIASAFGVKCRRKFVRIATEDIRIDTQQIKPTSPAILRTRVVMRATPVDSGRVTR